MQHPASKHLVCLSLCLLMALGALGGSIAEKRPSVIMLEGMEVPLEETLYRSPAGFSFWYPEEDFKAYPGKVGRIQGVIVLNPYSDDYMILSTVTKKEAEKLLRDARRDAAMLSSPSRIQEELGQKIKKSRVSFCTLIAENGLFLRADGEYFLEAAEGTAKYFDHILNSVTLFPPESEGSAPQTP